MGFYFIQTNNRCLFKPTGKRLLLEWDSYKQEWVREGSQFHNSEIALANHAALSKKDREKSCVKYCVN